MTTKKPAPTGLAAFTRKAQTQTAPTDEPMALAAAPDAPRQRGKGDTVALTVRLSRADWERVHQLAVSEGCSIQALSVDGLNRVFIAKGLPPLMQ
jgi:hypothetical protein